MKKGTLFAFITILAIIALFGLAALCNQCSIGDITGDSPSDADSEEDISAGTDDAAGQEDTSEPGDIEETPEEEETEEIGNQDDETVDPAQADPQEEQEEGDDGEREDGDPPTITLAVYQEAAYSSADDVCYWRIKAETTGDPEISWSKDDSFGAFGDDIAQVNLSRGENYNLTATAVNDFGTASDTIVLEWNCEDEEEETAPIQEFSVVESIELGIVSSISGSVTRDENVYPVLFVGDHPDQLNYKVRLSFDISDLAGSVITTADLSINNILSTGDPMDFGTFIYFHSINYGDSLDGSDYSGYPEGQIFAVRIDSMGTSIGYNGENLATYIQRAVDRGADYFQVGAGLGGADITNDDGNYDGYRFPDAGIKLEVNYYFP